MRKDKILERLLNNFKDPYFVIKIWQQIAVLGLIVGIFLGATLTQTYYIEQVNSVFEQAREQDGCFNNFYHNLNNGEYLGYMKNISPVLINSVTNNTSNPD